MAARSQRRARCGASFAGTSGKLDVGDAERIGDRIGDADRRRHAIAFADALGAERRERRRRLHVQDQRLRHFHGGRQQIVGERAGQEAAVGAIGVFLVKRGAEACAKPPRIWPSTMPGCRMVPQSCMVTYRSIRVCSVVRSISTPQKSKMKPWQSEELMWSASSGGGQFRRRPEHGLADRLADAVGQRRPATSGSAPRGGRTIPCCPGLRFEPTWPPANAISSTSTFSWLAAMRASRAGDARRRRACAVPATAGGEAAGVIARGDRPGVLGGVDLGVDADSLGREAEHVGDDLRQHGAMALPLRHRGDVHGHAADRIERDRSRSPARRSSARPCGARPASARW